MIGDWTLRTENTPKALKNMAGAVFTVALVFVISGCTAKHRFGPSGGSSLQGRADVNGEVLGSGSTRIALLAPLSANGTAGQAGIALRNAAELALSDFPDAAIELVVKDTAAQPELAAERAQEALDEHSSLIIGPLLSSSVSSVGLASRRAGVPVIAYSTDSTVAGHGVHLLSFLPRRNIETVISFAAKKGARSYAALVPKSAYGRLAEAAFREAVALNSGIAVTTARFDNSVAGQKAAIDQIVKVVDQFDTLFIPDLGRTPEQMFADLAAVGITPESKKILGGGQWNEHDSVVEPQLKGAFFPGPSNVEFNKFAARYQQRFGSRPPRIASLAYDSVILAAGLVSRFPQNPYSVENLTNPNGFIGIDGIFRLTSGGKSQRGIVIYRANGTGVPAIAQPAPSTFLTN